MPACAITAVGLVSVAGDDPALLFRSLLEGRTLSRDGPDADGPRADLAAFDPGLYLKRKGLGGMSRTSQLACAAASRIVTPLAGVMPSDVGVVFGTAWATLDTIVRFEREAYREGPRFVDPILFTETVANVPAGQVSIVFGWSALNATLAGATAGLAALAFAAELLAEERASVIVAGGADAGHAQLCRTLRADGRLASSRTAAPLDGCGSMPVPGEAACWLALERQDSTGPRDRAVLGTFLGGLQRGLDPSEAEAPQRAELIRDLLDRTGVGAQEIDLVVVSAGGDRASDRAEAAAVADVFGAHRPAAVLPKAVVGETWGAAGAIGVAVALEAARQRCIPPVPPAVLEGARRAGLDVAGERRSRAVRRALVLDGAGSPDAAAVLIAAAEGGA